MNFWRIVLDHGKGCVNHVYYKCGMKLSLENVARNAVEDGDLLAVFMPSVAKVEQISSEEYHQFMWE